MMTSHRRTDRRRSRSAFEPLEQRRLMSAAAAAATPASEALLRQGFAAVEWEGSQVYAKPGQWLVQFAGVSGKAQDQVRVADGLLKRLGNGIAAERHLGRDGLVLVRTAADVGARDLRGALATLPNFVRVEPDVAVWSSAFTPNDPSFSRQWGLNNTGQVPGVIDADVDAPEAWGLGTGDASIAVGVIDSGIDYNHPDLASNVWINPGEVAGNGVDDDGNGYVDDVRGWDFYNNDADPYDDNGHGTSVAGVIAATANNGIGVAGVAGATKVIPLKFMGADGSGTMSGAIAAVNYATNLKNRGLRVMATNNSWTAGGTYVSSLYDAVNRSGQAGMLFVAAAGNGGADYVGDNTDVAPAYPSSFNLANVVAVAATDEYDVLAPFSNYGATSVDLAAPGVSIYSTLPAANYGYNSGTSVASPYVAGVAALAWGRNPTASYATVRDALLGGVDAKASLAGKVATGGRLNAYNTLQLMGGGPVVTVPNTPTSLYAHAARSSEIDLIWNDVSNNEAGFRLYRSTDLVNFTPVAEIPADRVSYTATGLAAQTKYYFCISAFNSAGESTWSNVTWNTTTGTSAPVTAPAAPTGLGVTVISKSQVRLNWTDNSNNETGFQVERSSNGTTGWSLIATTAADATTFNTANAKRGGTYWFRVRAVNSAGASGYSNVASTGGATAATATAAATPATSPSVAPTFSGTPIGVLDDLGGV